MKILRFLLLTSSILIIFSHDYVFAKNFQVNNFEEFLAAYIEANESPDGDTISIIGNILITEGTFEVNLSDGTTREIKIPFRDKITGKTAFPPLMGNLIINFINQDNENPLSLKVNPNNVEKFRIFTTTASSKLSIAGSNEISGGNATDNESLFGNRGGAILNFGVLDIFGIDLRNCGAISGGAISNAGIYRQTDGSLKFNMSERGGAIENFSPNEIEGSPFPLTPINTWVNLQFTNIEFNTANQGGAIFNSSNMSLNEVNFTQNSSINDGGAIFNEDGYITLDSLNIFNKNSAGKSGGAIFNNGGKISVGSSIGGIRLNDNNAKISGGAIFNNGGKVDLKKGEITGNTGDEHGGAIVNIKREDEQNKTIAKVEFPQTYFVIEDSVITGSISSDFGGGIANFEQMTIRNSTISNNSLLLLDGFGGGIYNFGDLNIEGSTISGNEAQFLGGGILTEEGILTVSNSTISNNSAALGGGLATSFGTDSFINTTIVNNSTILESFGGGIFNFNATTRFINTIIADNSSDNGDNCFNATAESVIIDGGNNVSDNDDCMFNFNQFIDPKTMIGPLADNGGLTHTHALIIPEGLTNPAVDTGNDTVCGDLPVNGFDQRNFVRSSPCDIGSYEISEVEGPDDDLQDEDFFTRIEFEDEGEGGQILLDVPEGVKVLGVSLTPSVGECEINESADNAKLEDIDIQCNVDNFPEILDLSLDLCTIVQPEEEGFDDLVIGEVKLEVVSNQNPEVVNEDIVDLIITTAEQCSENRDNGGGSDGGSSGCTLSGVNDASKSLPIWPLLLLVVLFARRKKLLINNI